MILGKERARAAANSSQAKHRPIGGSVKQCSAVRACKKQELFTKEVAKEMLCFDGFTSLGPTAEEGVVVDKNFLLSAEAVGKLHLYEG